MTYVSAIRKIIESPGFWTREEFFTRAYAMGYRLAAWNGEIWIAATDDHGVSWYKSVLEINDLKVGNDQ